MKDERNKEIYESLPEEEKEKLNKFQKKGTTTTKATYDTATGKKIKEETEYNSEYKRKKGTFCISCPEEIVRLCTFSKIRAINTMLVYIICNVNYKNEFIFEKNFIDSYGIKNKQRFFTDRKYLLDNKYIFNKPYTKNVYTLNVELFSRGNAYITSQLYEEQFGEELNQDSKYEFSKIVNKVTKLSKIDMQNLIDILKREIDKK